MIDVGEGYRIPKIEEFIQGFEFEIKFTYKVILAINNTTEPFVETEITDNSFWGKGVVWWKPEIEHGFIVVNNMTIMHTDLVSPKPFNEEKFIRQGLVRVKI